MNDVYDAVILELIKSILFMQKLSDQQDLTHSALSWTPGHWIFLMLKVWDTCYIFIIPISIKNYQWLRENIDFSGGVYMHAFFSH